MRKLFAILFLTPFFGLAQNVGIGTSTPSRLLHVNGTGEVLRIQGSFPWIGFMNNTDANYNGFLYYPDTSLVMGSRSGSNQPLILAPNNEGLLFATASQRVGVGTPSPTEKLDVNGNINVTGTIKANGVDGTANQVLMKNSSGTMVWGDMCEFKNIATFRTGNAATWNIPTGTKRLWVELWGGGASGIGETGGSGGGYLGAIIEILDPNSPGAITYTIGTGGTGGVAGAANLAGTATTVFYTNPAGLSLTANGAAAPTVSGTVISGGLPGTHSVLPSTFLNYRGMNGKGGKPYTSILQNFGANTYETLTCGDGGDAGNAPETGGNGPVIFSNLTTTTLIRRSSAGNTGVVPGGGGSSGGAAFVSGIIALSGSNGGGGMLIIHY